MTGWNLPPGCTEADIDNAINDPAQPVCSGCGSVDDNLWVTTDHMGVVVSSRCEDCFFREEE